MIRNREAIIFNHDAKSVTEALLITEERMRQITGPHHKKVFEDKLSISKALQLIWSDKTLSMNERIYLTMGEGRRTKFDLLEMFFGGK